MKKVALLFAVLALFGLAACDSGPTAEEKKAAAKEQAKAKQLEKRADRVVAIATSCRQDIGELIGALQNINSRLAVGLNFDDYGEQVGKISVAYGRIPLNQLNLNCIMGPGVRAENALRIHAQAYNTWGDCISDLYCDTDSIDPGLQKSWAKASRQLKMAKAYLANLEGEAADAVDQAEAQQKKADQAVAALES